MEIVEETRGVSNDEIDVARLESFLRAHLALPAEPLVVERFPHGHSNLTYLVRCGGTKWVLRRPPLGTVAATAHDMKREARFMSALSAALPLVPRSYVYTEDREILGAPFHVVEHRTGAVVGRPGPARALDASTMRSLCGSFVEAFVRLHAVDYRAVGLADAGKPDGYAARQVSGWRERYQRAEIDRVPEMAEVGVWLEGHVPQPREAAVIHNDFKFDNLLLDPQDPTRVVAVLDWEMATIGDPWMDVGTTLALWFQADDPEALRAVRPGPSVWPGSLTRAEFFARYAETSGRPSVDPTFYYACGLFKLAAIFQQSYARYVKGATGDERFAGYQQKVIALARQAASTLNSGRL